MERVNQGVEVYLCTFINHHQDDWEDWLPAVVFSWNSKPGPTTRSPFETTKGYQPTMGPEPSWKGKGREAGRFVEEMEGVFKEMEATLKEAVINLTFGWFGKVTLAGIEPATFWLCMWCSTHWPKVSVKLWNQSGKATTWLVWTCPSSHSNFEMLTSWSTAVSSDFT